MITDERYSMTLIPRPPCVMSHGRGSWLWDEAGNRYLDFVQGWAVNALGHAPAELVETLTQQAQTLLTVSPAYFTRPLLDLSRELCEATRMDRVFLTSSGAEANDAAIKLVRKWAQLHRPGAHRVITTCDSFHGRTLACVSASGKVGWENPFPPMLEGFDKVPYGDVRAAANAITGQTAAIMVEPIQGEAGVVVPPTGYLKQLRELTIARGILLIFDEIQTGMGRTGTLLRGDAERVSPDILTLGKGLGSGVPIAALLAKNHAAAFVRGDHGGTYTGNPLTASCALNVLRTVNQTTFLANVRAAGKHLESALRGVGAKSPIGMCNIRGSGLLWACDLMEPVAEVVRDQALALGLLINAPRPNVLRFMPQLRVTANEISEMADRLLTALCGVHAAN